MYEKNKLIYHYTNFSHNKKCVYGHNTVQLFQFEVIFECVLNP